MAALAGNHCSFPRQVHVLNVEREDFPGPGGGLVQHPPQSLFPQVDVPPRPQRYQVLAGDGFGLIPGLAPAVYQNHGIVLQPGVALAIREEWPDSGEPGVPSGRLPRPPALLKDIKEPTRVQLVERKVPPQLLDNGFKCLWVPAAGVRRQMLVGKECFHRPTPVVVFPGSRLRPLHGRSRYGPSVTKDFDFPVALCGGGSHLGLLLVISEVCGGFD